MDFELSKEQIELRKSLRSLCSEKIAPRAADIDLNGTFPKDNFQDLAGRDYFGLLIPEKSGGQGADLCTGIIAAEEISVACASTGIAAGVSTWNAGKAIELYATDAIKEKYLPAMAMGESVGAFAVTEADSGSDTATMATTAARVDGGFKINGAKSYVTNATAAQFIIVMTKTDEKDGRVELSVFLVPTDTEGVSIGETLDTLGLRGAVAAGVEFNDCKIPEENLLGEEGKGAALLEDILDYARLNVSAVALGIARAAFETAKQYAETRKASGKPIGVFQEVSFRIADMQVEMDVARMMTFNAAWQKQQGMKCSPLVSVAKIAATDAAAANAGRALDIMAGQGSLRGCVAERLYRDAKLTSYAAGTSDIMREIVAADLLKNG